MSKRGALARIVKNFKDSFFVVKQKDTFVGKDQYGNRYFEKTADDAHNLRASRYIEKRKDLGLYEVPEVPVEWSAWLRGRRKDPPTPEEIEKNHITMLKTQIRARELDNKYAKTETSDLLGSGDQGVTEDIKSNPTRTAFPVYDDFEIAPGQKPFGKKVS